MAVTPDPNADPRFAGVLAALTGERQAAQRNAELRKREAETNFAYEQALLGRQKPEAQRNLDRGQLARGVFKSGETQRKRGQLEGDFLMREGAARNAMLARQNAADADLSSTLAGLGAREATERGDAIGRLNEQTRLAEERARAIAEQDRQIALQTAEIAKIEPPPPATPTYDTPDAYAAAANAYAAALAQQQAPAPAPRTPPRRPQPPRPPAPQRTPLRPISGRY